MPFKWVHSGLSVFILLGEKTVGDFSSGLSEQIKQILMNLATNKDNAF